MRVLLTSTSFPASPRDWKGLFILRMLEALARNPGLSVEAWCPPGPLPEGVRSALLEDDGAWLARLAERGGIAHALRTHPLHGLAAGVSLIRRQRRAFQCSKAELFHVNWLQNALALPADHRPALVTALGTDMQLLRIPGIAGLLRRKFSGRRVVLCPNAEWMVPALQETFGNAAKVKCVPFGIDASWYEVRRTVVSSSAARWLCVTRITRAKVGPLFEWAAPLFQSGERELHLVGPRQDPGLALPGWIRYHESATPEALQRDFFPQAAGFVSMSTHPEGRPQVMLEAMAAGIPILASQLPAHEDIVSHGKTGWICDDAAGFSAGLACIESPLRNLSMGEQARMTAKARFGDWDDCARRYAQVHAMLIPGAMRD